MIQRKKIIYLISGKARTGKGTIGSILKKEYEKRNYRVCEIQIMRTLKGYLKDYFGWDGREETKPRKMLQNMGTEVIREQMNKPFFHIDRLTEDILVLSNYFDIFIVNDIRLPLEIEILKERFSSVVSIHIIRENYISPLEQDEQKHITELALDDYEKFDYKIVNSSLNEITSDIIEIIDSEVDKNEIHD